MTTHSVVIAGAGPTGMTLAAELTLAGVDVVIVERRPTPELGRAGALGVHSRTIEVWDQRGIAERFLSAGKTAQVAGFGGTPLDLSDFPTRHPYGLALIQDQIERILAGWVDELKVPILRAVELTGFTQSETGVTVTLSDGRTLQAQYLVGCDGGRSLVRKTAGIEFPGSDATLSHIMAAVAFAKEPPWGLHKDAYLHHAFAKLDDGARVLVTEENVGGPGAPTLRELSDALIKLYGHDFGIHSPRWITRFTDMARQAANYRAGRVLLAGDAAHIHYPAGGQGLGIGVQDAVNLGWKLAQVVKGSSPSSLLDSYHSERHPIAARVLRHTLAHVALVRTDDRSKALAETVADLLRMDEPRKRYAGIISGLEIHYDLGAGHPLLGRRMPDLELGSRRLFTLLHAARPLLLNFGAPGAFGDLGGSAILRVDATYAGKWELPVLGVVTAPGAVLVRPDGYVVWVGTEADPALRDALRTWFGASA